MSPTADALPTRVLALFVLLALLVAPAAAQEAAPAQDDPEKNPYGSGLGLEIVLTNNGFGMGGYLHQALGRTTSFMAEVSLGAGKDEQEMKFFGFGRSYIPNKANYLLMMPVQIGIISRLFQESIEDNFRPFLQATGGPTLGWEYPYFNDANRNGTYDPNERTYDGLGALTQGSLRLGVGGTLAIGAHFGLSKKVTQGVRIGYAFTYFFEGVQLLEPDVQPDPQHFFSTPTISLIFGRLL